MLCYFAFNQIVKHLRIATRDLLGKTDYHAGLESRSATIKSTLDQNSARYGSVRLQPKIGKSERTSSERGLSGLQSEETFYCFLYRVLLPTLP